MLLSILKLLALARYGPAGFLIHGPFSYCETAFRETGLAATAPEIIVCLLQVSLLHELEQDYLQSLLWSPPRQLQPHLVALSSHEPSPDATLDASHLKMARAPLD